MTGPPLRKTENVLVTGGAGYIGSHACKALARAGFHPIAYDNLSSGHEWAVQWGPLETGDLLDWKRLDAVFSQYRPSAVLHFAAFAYVGESVGNPLKYYRNNVDGTLNLIKVMLEHGVGKIVFSSTCATYGLPQEVPISEEHPQRPMSPYGKSKLMVEQILRDCGAAYGLRSIYLRYFNAAGADPEGEIGEVHEPETHLIPLVLEAAAGWRPCITIHGSDYETHDGTCIRDFVHVTDLGEAHVLALKALDLGSDLTTYYNLGTGKGFSVRQVIETARQITNRQITVREGPRRPGDPPFLLADARQSTKLGWSAHHSDLHEIIATAWHWMMKHNARKQRRHLSLGMSMAEINSPSNGQCSWGEC
jgi:UDP-glucose-4-epimerase GalE